MGTGRSRHLIAVSLAAGIGISAITGCGSSAETEAPPETPVVAQTAEATGEPIAEPSDVETDGDMPYAGIFERSPLPESLQALYDMPIEEFKQQPKTAQLKLLSWLNQRQDDFNQEYAEYSGDQSAINIVPIAPTNTGEQLINKIDSYSRISLSFADRDDPNFPSKLDVNESTKANIASMHNLSNPLNQNQPSFFESGQAGYMVSMMDLSASHVFETTQEVTITETSAPYEPEGEPGITAIDVTYVHESGNVQVNTYRIVHFSDYQDQPATALTLDVRQK